MEKAFPGSEGFSCEEIAGVDSLAAKGRSQYYCDANRIFAGFLIHNQRHCVGGQKG